MVFPPSVAVPRVAFRFSQPPLVLGANAQKLYNASGIQYCTLSYFQVAAFVIGAVASVYTLKSSNRTV